MQSKLSVSRLSMRTATAMLIMLFISNNNILGISNGVGADTWIAQLLSIVTVVPLLLILGRLMRLMPGMDLFDMMRYLFGRHATIVLSALYFYYFITVAAIVRMYYAEFVHISSLVNTPLIVILFTFFIVCTYLAKSGSEALGKWSVLMVVVAVLIIVFSDPVFHSQHEFRKPDADGHPQLGGDAAGQLPVCSTAAGRGGHHADNGQGDRQEGEPL